MIVLDKYTEVVEKTEVLQYIGHVQAVRGSLIESSGPPVGVGDVCRVHSLQNDSSALAEVVALHGNTVQLMLFSHVHGLEVGSPVITSHENLSLGVGPAMLGRVLDAFSQPIDGGPNIPIQKTIPLITDPINPMDRLHSNEQIHVGIRAIDSLLAVGKGQRMGIFSGSGVGKSTMLGMIARNTAAEVNVIALIGERGREVREFIDHDLGPEGLKRSIVIVATSDSPPLARIRAAYVALAISEYFRDHGKDVMLLFDSITRFARAQREIGLARGEAPAFRGFPTSVEAVLPRLLERCGRTMKGSITGFFSLLVEGDDLEEPISDTTRGILDGHIILSRKLARRSHYPAIDVLASVSRLSDKILPDEIQEAARSLRKMLAIYDESEDIIQAGVYVQGSNATLDAVCERMDDINAFLQQRVGEHSPEEDTKNKLFSLVGYEVL